jgi:dolichol-phosphate mannosyltransferase
VIYIVIPAYDEAPNMQRLFDGLRPVARALGARVVLVDDGSTDATADLARNAGADLDLRIVQHEVNRGLGAALDTGLRTALEEASDDDFVVTAEGDGTSDLGDLRDMLAKAEEYDVVLASVHAPGGRLIGVARWRVLASKAASWVVRHAARLGEVHTVSAVYRCYRVSALRRTAARYEGELITERGFAVNVELLLKLKACGASVCEVPTTNDWTQRAGASKLRTRETLLAYGRVLRNHRSGLRNRASIAAVEAKPR